MMFGYLGKDKIEVSGNWKHVTDREDVGKYVIAEYFRSGELNFCVGILSYSMQCATMACRRYKVISKETYDLLTS